jgi:DNA-binding transcriptional ArsR family regulator
LSGKEFDTQRLARDYSRMKRQAVEAQTILRALAEPRRVAILKLVHAGELRAGQIAGHFKATHPAISQHLRVLVKAGLLSERRRGTRRLYRVRPEGFAQLRALLGTFWEDSLAGLKMAAESEARRRSGR